MRRYLNTLFHPEFFHHEQADNRPYFEGWYYKLIDATEEHRLAVIPGLFRSTDPAKDHAFVQILDGISGKVSFHRFPDTAFKAAEGRFEAWVGRNHFTGRGFTLDIDDEQRRVHGTVELGQLHPWPVRFYAPGVMGPLGFLPNLECYHGVLGFDHSLTGSLNIDDHVKDFTGGRGYLEKDWGQAFPVGYTWMQTNHFEVRGVSFETAVALVPLYGRIFKGFQCGLWLHNKLYAFTAWNGSVLQRLEVADDQVDITFRNAQYRLDVLARRAGGNLLYSPVRSEMHLRVEETMKANIYLRLSTNTGQVIFDGTGRNAALEVHGDIDRLLTQPL